MTICSKKDVSTGTSHGKLSANDEFEESEEEEELSYEEITERLLTTVRRANVVDKKRKLPMRESLFAHVPPYIIFHANDKNDASLPREITRHLLWWHTKNFSPGMIRLTVLKSGFTITGRSMANWCGTWCTRLAYQRANKKLKRFQKVNHFPNCDQLSNKIQLWKNFDRMAKRYGKKSFDYLPFAYILPGEGARLKKFMDRKSGSVWILKPADCCAGQGIRLISRSCEIPKRSPYVAQRYVCHPSLINGYKYDLRLYVLLTSIDPLRIFLYSEGLVRLATVKYQHKLDNLYDRFMHLTNTTVNKFSPRFRGNDDVNKQEGNMWSLTALWNYLRSKERADINRIWLKIKDIIIKTIISAESSIAEGVKKSTLSNYNNCQLFGFDILLDVHLEPWLLEVNECPSMNTETPLCVIVKSQLARDFLNLVGFHVPDILTPNDRKILKGFFKTSRSCYDHRLYGPVPLNVEKQKQDIFETQSSDRESYLNIILKTLTPDDVRVLIRHEDELAQTGKFERIFPTRSTYEYFKYFDNVSYYNMLLDAWEHAYGNNDRAQGINRLKKLCDKGYHLIQDPVYNIENKIKT
ncbi:hypothetical protein KPH14_004625 [Odynerus spinipes]|uniref:Tubulin polyglutamylase TTLL4 n=1 Tax=Odynerus spinipes TaxID=1348599 RepID=A0AAD9RM82_9HYME|nr:hypothetical protein KPH14_004625 [Odynerus spinipes]